MDHVEDSVMSFLREYRHLLDRSERRRLYHALTDGSIVFRPDDAVKLLSKLIQQWEEVTGNSVSVSFEGFHAVYIAELAYERSQR